MSNKELDVAAGEGNASFIAELLKVVSDYFSCLRQSGRERSVHLFFTTSVSGFIPYPGPRTDFLPGARRTQPEYSAP